jgi:uncharacterized repeat protein (TIGR01451 family)
MLAAGTIAAVVLATAMGVPIASATPAAPAAATTTCPTPVALQNGGFAPTPITAIAPNKNAILPQASFPPWQTTESQGQQIEVWRQSLQLGFPTVVPYSGPGTPNNPGDPSGLNFMAEMNAYHPATLYQRVATTPGQTVTWRVWHHGRVGPDSGFVAFGPTLAAVQAGGTAAAPTLPPAPFLQVVMHDSEPNTAVTSFATSAAAGVTGSYAGGAAGVANGWGLYQGFYTIPAGQTTTFFGFGALTSSTGDGSIGNFIGGIQFGNAACMTVDKTATDLQGHRPARVGDTVEYQLTATNAGGFAASSAVAVDQQLPAGTAYVPGSLRIDGVAQSDAAGDDRAQTSPGPPRTVTFRLGTGATATTGGTLQVGETHTATFQVTVVANPDDVHAAVGGTLSNQASLDYTDDATGRSLVADSPPTDTSVEQPADVSVAKSGAAGTVGPGQRVSYVVTARNLGPADASGVRVSDELDPQTTLVSSSPAGCTASVGVVSCPAVSLANGASTSWTVTVLIAPDSAVNTALVDTARVLTEQADPVPGNNVASDIKPVVPAAHLAVTKTGPASATAGGSFDYTLTVTNTGPTDATGVVLTDTLPAGLSAAVASPPRGTCTTTAAVSQVSCALGVVPVGTLQIPVRVTVP